MSTFIVSDMHIPYQDNKALDIMFKIQYQLRPKEVVITGDLFDFPKISRFKTDPLDQENFTTTMNSVVGLIKRLQKYSKVTLMYGNHEMRMRNYIWSEAPYLAGEIDLKKFIETKLDKPITFVEGGEREAMLWYDDNILLGHFNKINMHSAYTAKNLCDKYQCNLCQAHTHRQGIYYKRTFKGTMIGVENGCLCGMNPKYVVHPDWQQGFAIYQRYGKSTNIELVQIRDGECIFRGRLIKGSTK
jgi:UDP-2,3-diacylglucosamine pyrophosphatase LpxH